MRKMLVFLLTLVRICMYKMHTSFPSMTMLNLLIVQYIHKIYFLIVENKPDLIRLLSLIECKWKQIGQALKISHGDLKKISDQRSQDTDRLADVVQFWLDKQPSEITWATVITAVELPPVLEPSIASTILDTCLSITTLQAGVGA